MPVIRRVQTYSLADGNKDKILAEPFTMNGTNNVLVFNVQANFSGLDVTSAATVYLMLSNDGTNYVRVTGKEFAIAGAGQASFFIFGDQNMGRAQYMQLGITGVAGPGLLKTVFIGY